MSKTQRLPGIIVFRGNTEEVAARQIIDRQFVFDIEKNEFYIDTNNKRVKCGQDASKIEDIIFDIKGKVDSGEIVSKDTIDGIIDDISDKQQQIEHYDDVLYKEKWDLFSDEDDSVHEYYYQNDKILFGAEIHITPIIETVDEYNNVSNAILFPSIDTFIGDDKQNYYLIRAKNVPSHNIRIHISVVNRG